jgi:hypothetical protein
MAASSYDAATVRRLACACGPDGPRGSMGVSKTWGRLLAHFWLVGTGSVVFTSLRLAFACSGTVRYVTPAPMVRHQPAPGF